MINHLAGPSTHRWQSAIPVISDREFEMFQAFIHRETGSTHGEEDVAVAKLARRLRELGRLPEAITGAWLEKRTEMSGSPLIVHLR
jgi:hypothetical protein